VRSTKTEIADTIIVHSKMINTIEDRLLTYESCNNDTIINSQRKCPHCNDRYNVLTIYMKKTLILRRKRLMAYLQCHRCGDVKRCKYSKAKIIHIYPDDIFDGGALDSNIVLE
jgi:hypothetical protein